MKWETSGLLCDTTPYAGPEYPRYSISGVRIRTEIETLVDEMKKRRIAEREASVLASLKAYGFDP